MANTGVSTRFDMKRSLSSAVRADSRMLRKEGSMKCADLHQISNELGINLCVYTLSAGVVRMLGI